MKKTVMILLSCIMLASCLVSCDTGDISQVPTQPESESFEQNELPTQPESESFEQNELPTQPEPEPLETIEPVDYTKESDTPYMAIPYDMVLAAELYLAAGERVESDEVFFTVTDGKVTWKDVLFDEISYEQNIDVKYDSLYHYYVPNISVGNDGTIWDVNEKNEFQILMARIAQQKHCYILKSSMANEVADFIAAYYLDGVCYLALIKNDVVSRIYCFEAAYAEPVLTEGMVIKSENIASQMGIGDARVILTVVDGQIYKGKRLQKIKYYGGFKIDIEWCRENLDSWKIGTAAGMELLERMQEEHGCFVIYPVDPAPYNRETAIYVIDGEYYFFDITKAYWRGICISNISKGVPSEKTE